MRINKTPNLDAELLNNDRCLFCLDCAASMQRDCADRYNFFSDSDLFVARHSGRIKERGSCSVCRKVLLEGEDCEAVTTGDLGEDTAEWAHEVLHIDYSCESFLPYVTGSRAYGDAWVTDKSDLDLVMCVDKLTRYMLINSVGGHTLGYFYDNAYGKLNLVVFDTNKEEDKKRALKWRYVNDWLIENKAKLKCKDDACFCFRIEGVEEGYLGRRKKMEEIDNECDLSQKDLTISRLKEQLKEKEQCYKNKLTLN